MPISRRHSLWTATKGYEYLLLQLEPEIFLKSGGKMQFQIAITYSNFFLFASIFKMKTSTESTPEASLETIAKGPSI